MNENEVSWKKCKIHSQFHDESKHSGVSNIGRILALTHIIPNVLKMFDQTKLATHISYFFLIMAVIVVANSGRLVPAAIMVAQIAHSDIHKVWAINTAASTITSDAMTNNHILAISFVIFNSIHLEVSLAQGILLLNTIIINIKNNKATNIQLTLSIHNFIAKPLEVSMLTKANNATPMNRYIKFFILGTETSILSSVGDSFLIIKYPLYHTNKASRVIHSRKATCWSHSIIKINAVTARRNAQSLYTNFFWMNTGAAMADTHRIIHKLNILDQIIFHIDNDPLHCMAAIHDKNSSGADVQIARMVNQINKSETLKCLAILTLVLIRWLAEKTKRYSQTISTIVANIIIWNYMDKLTLI